MTNPTMTDEQFGDLIGVGPSQANRIRNGHRLPGIKTMDRIHQKLGVSHADLINASTSGRGQFSKLIRRAIDDYLERNPTT